MSGCPFKFTYAKKQRTSKDKHSLLSDKLTVQSSD